MPPEPAPPAAPAAPPSPPTPPAAGATPANDPAPASAPPAEPTPSELGDAGKRALDAERTARATAEKAAKNAERELAKLREAAMSDQEKAVAAARDEGRTQALKEAGERLAAAEIRAALTGVVADPSAIVEDLALDRYVGDDGQVDGEAVEKLKAKYVALMPAAGGAASAPASAPVPGVAAGARPTTGPAQLSRAELRTMSPAEIVQARQEGRLRDVLTGGG
jgi:hypothetical protein